MSPSRSLACWPLGRLGGGSACVMQEMMQERGSYAADNYERHNLHDAPLVTGGFRLALH